MTDLWRTEWTTTELLASIKLRAGWPTSNAPLSDAQLLTLANEELQSEVFPLVLASQGDYRVYDLDRSITADQQLYKMPKRAHGGRLKDVLHVSATSGETSLSMINIEEVGHLNNETDSSTDGLQIFLKNDHVGLYPTPTSTRDTLRQRYYMRPGKLVVEADAFRSSFVNTGANTTIITFTANHGFADTTLDPSEGIRPLFDWISGDGTFRTVKTDITANTGGSSAMLAFTPADVADVVRGDWLAYATESPIPQVPDATHPYLAQRAAVRALAYQGDTEGLRVATAELTRMEDRLDNLLAPRMDGEPKVIVPRHSPIRSATARRRWQR